MATKLKNLKITSVDLVEQGANPDAHIKLYKSKEHKETGAAKNSLLERFAQKLALVLNDFLQEKERVGDDNKSQSQPVDGKSSADKEERGKQQMPKEKEVSTVEQEELDTISLEWDNLTARERKFLWELARKKQARKSSESLQVAKAKAELASIEKQIEHAKTMQIAKQYEILGKEPTDLCNVLLAVQKSCPQGYHAFLDALEEQKILLEKTGIFTEVGKSRDISGGDGWAQIVRAADHLQKENPHLTRATAIQKACEKYPQLVDAYEENL